MASVFLYHVVGDLTVGKPEMVEFYETETVESAIRAIGESTEYGIPIWRKKSTPLLPGFVESSEMRQHRFVGILNSLDIVAFLAKSECLQEDKAMKILINPGNLRRTLTERKGKRREKRVRERDRELLFRVNFLQ